MYNLCVATRSPTVVEEQIGSTPEALAGLINAPSSLTKKLNTIIDVAPRKGRI